MFPNFRVSVLLVCRTQENGISLFFLKEVIVVNVLQSLAEADVLLLSPSS